MEEHSGLREQRKRATREALGAAALDIVGREGIDALTAARVAEAAGVSRRTLFNYFPRLEDVLTASIEGLVADTVAAVVARPSEEPLRQSLLVVLEEILDSPTFAQARVLEQAATESPATRRFLREFTESQGDAFEEGLRQRIGADADPVYVASLAAAAVGILSRLTRLSVALDPVQDAGADNRYRARLRQAFDHLFAGFDESGASVSTPPGDPTVDQSEEN